MSEVTYKRELNHSYMVVRCDTCNISESYAYRMMTQNRIGRLLQCSLRQLDGEPFLYYDISSRQPFERLYEARKLDVEGLKQILYAVAAIQADLGEYLLDEQGLMLEAGMIFADVETEELYFCFNPEKRDTGQRYGKLADFFLEHVDHGEEHAVNIAYQFYKLSKTEYFVLSTFLPFLEKELGAWRAEKSNLQTEGRVTGRLERDAVMVSRETGSEAVTEWTAGPEGDLPLWEDLQEPEEEEPCSRERKGWLARIFGKKGNASDQKKNVSGQEKNGFARKKNASGQEKNESGWKKRKLPKWKRMFTSEKPERENTMEEDWTDSVWNSYAEQEAFVQTGETVYFADLDKPKRKPVGIPCLTEEDGERQFRLENLPLTVGKLKGKVAIVLEDGSVSRMHARFESGGGGICVRDLNSRNGTLVNGRKLSPDEAAELSFGDLIQFGRERFRFGMIDSKALK